MADAEAKALIHAADKDGNQGIDFNEFAKFWETLHGESDVRLKASLFNVNLYLFVTQAVREEFSKIDADKSGYITKGIKRQ